MSSNPYLGVAHSETGQGVVIDFGEDAVRHHWRQVVVEVAPQALQEVAPELNARRHSLTLHEGLVIAPVLAAAVPVLDDNGGNETLVVLLKLAISVENKSLS